MFSGVGKTARELALAVDEGILCVNVESEPELELLSRSPPRKGRTRAYVGPRQSRHRCEDPSQDRDRQGREQVRHSDQPRARGLCACREAAGHRGRPASTCISAARSPISSRSATPSRCSPISCATLRADGHTIRMSISAAGSAFPIATTTSRRPIPTPMPTVVKRATRDLDCKLIFEPGRLIVGNAGILVTRVLFVKHGEAKNFVIVDAGDERSDAPDAYDAHHEICRCSEPRAGRAASSPTWSARSAKVGDFLALDRDHAGAAARRPAGGDDGRRLWGGAGRNLQHPRRSCRKCWSTAREWAVVRPRLEVDAVDRARPHADLALRRIRRSCNSGLP